MALAISGTIIAMAALVVQIIVWRTARTDAILYELLAELRLLRQGVDDMRQAWADQHPALQATPVPVG